MKYAFAGDRDIAVKILKLLLEEGHYPSALMVASEPRQTHASELIALANVPSSYVFSGKQFGTPEAISVLNAMELDYIIGIHFPYIIPKSILGIPRTGVINLHPAFLPWNKGWHTPSWAIIDGTPYGATLHFMSEKLDEGDIIHQKKLDVLPHHTADTLYKKVLLLEYDVFKEALSDLVSLDPPRKKQQEKGTLHHRSDLKTIREINRNENYNAGKLIDLLRGLTTNTGTESAFFEEQGKKYAVNVTITPIDE